jgi:hypothetical protein
MSHFAVNEVLRLAHPRRGLVRRPPARDLGVQFLHLVVCEPGDRLSIDNTGDVEVNADVRLMLVASSSDSPAGLLLDDLRVDFGHVPLAADLGFEGLRADDGPVDS